MGMAELSDEMQKVQSDPRWQKMSVEDQQAFKSQAIDRHLGESMVGSIMKATGLGQPGGLLSAPNIGTIGGPLLSGAIASAYGLAPEVAIPMGIAAAGLGGILGKGGEMIQNPPSSLGEAGSQLAGQAGESMLAQTAAEAIPLEPIVKGAVTGAGAIGGSIKDMLAKRLVGQAIEQPLLSAGQALGSGGIKKTEQLLGMIPFGTGKMTKFRASQSEQAKNLILKMGEGDTPGVFSSQMEAGTALKGGPQRTETWLMGKAGTAYDKSREVMGDAPYQPARLMQKADELVGTGNVKQTFKSTPERMAGPFQTSESPGPRGPGGAPLGPGLTPGATTPQEASKFQQLIGQHLGVTPESVPDASQGMTYGQMDDLKKAINRKIRGTSDANDRMNLLEMSHALGDDMVDATKAAGKPEAAILTKTGNDIYHNKIYPIYRDPEVVKILQDHPDKIAQSFISPNMSVETAKTLKRAVGYNAWRAGLGSWKEGLVNSATSNGQLDILKASHALNAYPDDTLYAIFGGRGKQAVQLKDTLAKMSSGYGGVSPDKFRQFFGWMQVATAASIPLTPLGVPFPKSRIALAFAPKMVSDLLFSPRFIKWATTAVNSPPGSKAVAHAMTQLGALHAEHMLEAGSHLAKHQIYESARGSMMGPESVGE